jgi:hypothetical protein
MDGSVHQHRLTELQKMRGRIYVECGALDPSQLAADGRHVQAADQRSWHVLTLDSDGRIAACARYLPHAGAVEFEELGVARTELARSTTWGEALRSIVEADLRSARQRGCAYVELGGWAISTALRCTTEAIRTITTTYALAELCGGGLGITTASTRHCSSAILQRAGGQRLSHGGVQLPTYYDEHYHCEIEILRFDALEPNPYRKWIDACRAHLKTVSVICRAPADAKIGTVPSVHASNLALIPSMAT